MANISLYVSGQSEPGDVAEFFQKGLMSVGEHPIAFFDGVFYESHQERVGNIAFQDYLVYSDKAVYLWARGSAKDFLDRFELGSVSLSSRNKDHDFSTLNLKVRREGKEPLYVIFDMVERSEAEQIVKLHTVIESIIEEHLGNNFRQPLPDDVSAAVLHAVRSVCPPRTISVHFDAPGSVQADSSIGYGQDLLEQYKAAIGYANPDIPHQQTGYAPAAPAGGEPQGGFSPADAMKGLEGLMSGDPPSLAGIAGTIKELIGDAPFRFRDQVKQDLQHVPGMLNALNELLSNISENPQAERFVMNIVKTAVQNDGMIGSVGKLIKLSSSFNAAPKRKAQGPTPKSGSPAGASNVPNKSERDFFAVDDSSYRRKNVRITSDADAPLTEDCFGHEAPAPVADSISTASAISSQPSPDHTEVPVGRRKKISITADEGEIPAIVRDMMNMDAPAADSAIPETATVSPSTEGSVEVPSSRRKISIVSEEAKGEAQSPEKTASPEWPGPEEIAAAFEGFSMPDELKDEKPAHPEGGQKGKKGEV
ncbi:MAG: hypothetical protein WCH05_00720 [Chlorobiaceae bacterium]